MWALFLAVTLTLTGGALFGQYSQRWGPPPDLQAAAAQLELMPEAIGPWRVVEAKSLDESIVGMLECAGHVNRQYLNGESGAVVKIFAIVGPPGPTAVHTPEVCYSSRAYEKTATRELESIKSSTGVEHAFWRIDFSSRNLMASKLRVYYAWSRGQRWEASEAPRYQHAGAPLLYKIQLAANTPPDAIMKGQEDPCREFLEALISSKWSLIPNNVRS